MAETLPDIIRTDRDWKLEQLRKLVLQANDLAAQLADDGVRVKGTSKYYAHPTVGHFFGFEYQAEHVALLKV